MWTPGPANSAYFEHAFLARQMGVELVEASDLVVRDDVCYMRTTSGLARVNAIYRRLDDAFIDPLEFRPDSLLGVPGLIRAYRAGTVAIVNAIGTGVADDKAVYCYVPEMIRFYLGEEPLLENVTTYLLDDPSSSRRRSRASTSSCSSRPASRAATACVIGPATDERRLEALAARGAQPARRNGSRRRSCALSTVPTVAPDGTLAARHVDLRPFAIFGEQIRIVPGGLTRVALEPGSLIVNSSRGGGSKDTWVLEDDDDLVRGRRRSRPALRSPALPDLRLGSWTGQAQQQQQGRAPRPDARADRPRALLARAQRLPGRAHRADDRRRLPGRRPGPPGGARGRHAVVGRGARDHGLDRAATRAAGRRGRRPSRC